MITFNLVYLFKMEYNLLMLHYRFSDGDSRHSDIASGSAAGWLANNAAVGRYNHLSSNSSNNMSKFF